MACKRMMSADLQPCVQAHVCALLDLWGENSSIVSRLSWEIPWQMWHAMQVAMSVL